MTNSSRITPSIFSKLTNSAKATLSAQRSRRIKHGLWGAVAMAVAMGANPAHATVQVTNVQLAGPAAYYTVNINGENVYDAALVLTINNQQIFSNCDDIYHNIAVGQNTAFTASTFSTAAAQSNFHGGTYSASQIGAMSWLLDKGTAIWQAGSAQPNEQLNLAALQLASWMIGNPNAVFSSYNTGVYNLAQSYITQSAGKFAAPGETIEQLTSSSGVQGQIFASHAPGAVPEPSTWALMLAGFGMVGYAMRKRNHGSAAVYA